jgi:prevent-host-death family protein
MNAPRLDVHEPTTYNIHQAKTQLSRLVARVEQGEQITISRAGKPVATLVPYRSVQLPRQYGRLEGQILIHDDFDELPEDVKTAFGTEQTENDERPDRHDQPDAHPEQSEV